MDSSSLTIGQVAKGAGVGVETVRFYEREGLVPAPKRRPSGYRQYPADTVRRIRFVQAAKDLGFTLKEVRELLSLRVSAGKSCADVRDLAHQKLAAVDAKLVELQRVRTALAELAEACTGSGPTSECPFLDALDAQGDAHGHG
jgi:Hg(II)-responsive transcriptional regulator